MAGVMLSQFQVQPLDISTRLLLDFCLCHESMPRLPAGAQDTYRGDVRATPVDQPAARLPPDSGAQLKAEPLD